MDLLCAAYGSESESDEAQTGTHRTSDATDSTQPRKRLKTDAQ